MRWSSRVPRGAIVAVFMILLTCVINSAASQSAEPPGMTVSQILGRMAQNTKGLTTFIVPFHMDAHVKKGMFSVHKSLDGTGYYKAPDKSTLKFTKVPSVFKDFVSAYSWVGTPATWPSIYDITLASSSASNVYELRGTYKPGSTLTHAGLDKAAHSSLDHVLLDVDKQSFDPVRVVWVYRNGSTITMNLTIAAIEGKYRLPQSETEDMNVPGYHVTGVTTFGTYQTNVPVPDSMFSQ